MRQRKFKPFGWAANLNVLKEIFTKRKIIKKAL